MNTFNKGNAQKGKNKAKKNTRKLVYNIDELPDNIKKTIIPKDSSIISASVPLIHHPFFSTSKIKIEANETFPLRDNQILLSLINGISNGRTVTTADLKNFLAVCNYISNQISDIRKRIATTLKKEESISTRLKQIEKKEKKNDFLTPKEVAIKKSLQKEAEKFVKEKESLYQEIQRLTNIWCVRGGEIPLREVLREYRGIKTIGKKVYDEFIESLQALSSLHIHVVDGVDKGFGEKEITERTFTPIPNLEIKRVEKNGKVKKIYIRVAIHYFFFYAMLFEQVYYLNSEIVKKLRGSALLLYFYLTRVKSSLSDESGFEKVITVNKLLFESNITDRPTVVNREYISECNLHATKELERSLEKLVSVGFLENWDYTLTKTGEQAVKMKFATSMVPSSSIVKITSKELPLG